MAVVLAGCKLATYGKFNNCRAGMIVDGESNISIYDVVVYKYHFDFNPCDYSNYNPSNENMVI